MPETQWMTLRETADMMKTLPEQVTQMCKDGKLEYYLDDGRYFVSRESIDLFMHPPPGQTAPANPDSNGTPRRMYGRAPHDVAPLPEPASDSEVSSETDALDAADGPVPGDVVEETPGREDAADGSAPEVDMEESPGREDAADGSAPEVDMEESPGREDEIAEMAEDAARPQIAGHSDDDELQTSAHSGDDENQMEPVDEAAPPGEVLPGENAGPGPSIQDVEQEEAEEDPGEPDERAAEILADLRAVLSRHAREHKAFCEEIAALADALESTLSRDGDKTSELTREISSLLARYTRR